MLLADPEVRGLKLDSEKVTVEVSDDPDSWSDGVEVWL